MRKKVAAFLLFLVYCSFFTLPCDHLVVSSSWRILKSRCLGITDTARAEKSRVFEKEENNF